MLPFYIIELVSDDMWWVSVALRHLKCILVGYMKLKIFCRCGLFPSWSG